MDVHVSKLASVLAGSSPKRANSPFDQLSFLVSISQSQAPAFAHFERHKRHILLKEIGGHGQNLIANSHIAIIGAGGLGCPCLLYLAAAGIGKITIIDDDIVDISNLQRLIIFKTNDIGTPKVDCAKREIMALDDNIEIITHQCRINKENAENLLKDADIIIDGCDNFETRFIVNEASFKLKKVLISGALGQFEGQIMAFDYRGGNGPCYNCFVPDMPQTQENCNIMGDCGRYLRYYWVNYGT